MTSPLLPNEVTLDPFERRCVGTHGAFLLRTNHGHVRLACAAVALRMDVPVGAIEVDWGAVRTKRAPRLRKVA